MTEALTQEEKPDPAAARVVARVRLMMIVSGATTLIAVAAVLFVIGYRLFRSEGSTGVTAGGAPAEVTATLPKGARVTATAVAGERLVVTIETAGGGTEIRTFDLATLRPTGRLRIAPEP